MSFYTNHLGYHPSSFLPLYDTKGQPLLDKDGQQKTQALWPPHCVQGSKGSQILVPAYAIDHIIQKGADPKFDSYSGFKDDSGHETILNQKLRKLGITDLVIYGIALDYCVKATVLDALKEKYNVSLILGLSRGVTSKSSKAAIEEMEESGAKIYQTLEDFGKAQTKKKNFGKILGDFFSCGCFSS